MADEFAQYRLPSEPVDWHYIEPTFRAETSDGSPPDAHRKCSDVSRSTSAYALFFRERQASEKRIVPCASFGELSKRIARQWESLSTVQKSKYKARCEEERRRDMLRAVDEKARRLLHETLLRLQ